MNMHGSRFIRRLAAGLLALASLAGATHALAQSAVWTRNVFGPGTRPTTLGDGDIITRAIAVDRDGNVIVTGTTHDGTSKNWVTTKLAADSGNIVWQKVFNGPAGRDDEAMGVAVDAAGNAVVVGAMLDAGGRSDVKVVRYAAADGAVTWEASFDGGAADYPYAVAIDGAGNALVAAESVNAASNNDVKILKYSASGGALLWQRTIDNGSDDYVSDIAVDAGGNVLATGVAMNAAGNADMLTFKLSAATGSVLWSKSLDAAGGADEAYAIAVDAAGNALVTGYVTLGGDVDARTLKYAAGDGALLWQQTMGGPGEQRGQAIAVDAAGNALVGAMSTAAAGHTDFRTAKYAAANGALAWEKSYDGGAEDNVYQIAVDGAGNAIVAGSTEVGGNYDWRAIQYAAADGATLWSYTHAGPAGGADDNFGVAVASGAIYLAGTTSESNGTGLRVVKLAGVGGAPGGRARAVSHDFDGDGQSDVLWQHTNGNSTVSMMNGLSASLIVTLIPGGSGWESRAVADFDGDGKADILWQHTDGRAAIWLMNGTAQVGGAAILGAGTGWSAVEAADFNGDGKADILWQHADGRASVWLMNGATQAGGAALLGAGTGWVAKVTGDFNGDGKADIVWQHTNGTAAMWLMNGTTQVGGGRLIDAASGWTPVVAGDFDRDGRDDLVWQHTNGSAAAWMMNGATQVGGARLLDAGTGWAARRSGDFNRDGRSDIVWQHADGRTAVWLMNGAAQAGGSAIASPGAGFAIPN